MYPRALHADFLMLVTAIIWGSAFVAQRAGMDHIGPFLYNGLRFCLATLALLPLLHYWPRKPRAIPQRNDWLGGLLLGVVLTTAANLQQVGLLFTTVTNAGFITGLYVIIVPLIGIVLGHRAGLGTWGGAALAVVGMFMLSVGEGFSVASGDWLQLIGAVLWAVHVILVGHLVATRDPLRLAMQQLGVCGLISLGLAVAFEPIAWQAIKAALPAVLYGGLIGVAIGYTLQLVAQRNAIASHAAIIFSLEAVFAAIAGALMLNESLDGRGYAGCALMLVGMLVAQLWPRREAGYHAPESDSPMR
ncbi:DMT family transporter [Pseudomonas sp. Marseille-QA0892]